MNNRDELIDEQTRLNGIDNNIDTYKRGIIMMNQRTATVQTVLNVLADKGVVYELNGPKAIKDCLDATDKEKIRAEMFRMFKQGEITIATEYGDADLKKYINGLVNNWITKAPEFNGGKKHEIKNPGSRAGSGNPEVKNMRLLLEQVADPETKALIQAEIDKATAPKEKATIDASFLPESLRHLVK